MLAVLHRRRRKADEEMRRGAIVTAHTQAKLDDVLRSMHDQLEALDELVAKLPAPHG